MSILENSRCGHNELLMQTWEYGLPHNGSELFIALPAAWVGLRAAHLHNDAGGRRRTSFVRAERSGVR